MTKTQGTVHLTKRFIDSAEYDGSAMCIFWDDDIPGFGLRVYPGGRKSFVLKYRHLGRQHIAVIARYGDYTLEQARRDAIDKRGCLVRGEDPFVGKRARAACATVKELGQAFLERYSKPNKSSWEHDERRLEKKIYPYLGSRAAASITRADMESLQKKLGAHSIHEADHTLNLFSKMVEWGKYAKVDSENFKQVDTFLPEDFINPCRGIKKFHKNKRDRWVRPDELPKLMVAVNETANIYIRAAIWLYLLTGMRKSELLCARWQDFDPTRRELRLPKTKAGRIHYVPLSEPAMNILMRLPRVEGNPHILVGHVTGNHLVNIDKPWRAVRERASLPDVHLHDLRRTVGSYLAQSGSSLQLIGKILNHSNLATTEIYARLAEEQSKLALDRHGKQVVTLAGAEFSVHPDGGEAESRQVPVPGNAEPAADGGCLPQEPFCH